VTDLAAELARQPILAGLDPAHLRALAEHARPVTYEPAERIFSTDDPADRFWVVGSGSVALDLGVPGRGDQVLETLVAGTVLGWSWLVEPHRWHFGAVARTRVGAVEFDAAAVRARCDADPAFGYAVLRLVTPVLVDRLLAARLRLLDLYAAPRQESRS
jgi:CRP/FNR family transcriptional regulator, cyclic AMP receptor protein